MRHKMLGFSPSRKFVKDFLSFTTIHLEQCFISVECKSTATKTVKIWNVAHKFATEGENRAMFWVIFSFYAHLYGAFMLGFGAHTIHNT